MDTTTYPPDVTIPPPRYTICDALTTRPFPECPLTAAGVISCLWKGKRRRPTVACLENLAAEGWLHHFEYDDGSLTFLPYYLLWRVETWRKDAEIDRILARRLQPRPAAEKRQRRTQKK